MKTVSWLLIALLFVMASRGFAQAPRSTYPPGAVPAANADDDLAQLNSDVQRLKVLVNQMRTNMAFVQSSQTPLKQQFQLEADAWQIVISQMERHIQRMEDRQRAVQPRP